MATQPGEMAGRNASAIGRSAVAASKSSSSAVELVESVVGDRAVVARHRRARSLLSLGVDEEAPGDLRIVEQVARREGPRRRPTLEAGQAVGDVMSETRFAHLAVADHVDAGRDLLAHRLVDCGPDPFPRDGCIRCVFSAAEQER